ncbi:GNAT family N-acetyltransferase [Oscillatoria sp. FACHB-1406]|uniref:GNAT family N-acetyltransferase n=1 Tax=Oscillatoria sp. FACHB-1406 TaxID=2692846 RepID=UPI0016859AF1|nr:GNAT family N-acetyltransferase [Oscillatoria sp. FACHB-1406]MBD2579596.1 GNAT family N-acetyltransferase [Oscillatoria sp. FACHB-1406]
MTNNSLNIRPMQPKDLQLALDWAAAEGWNPGLHDAIAFYASDRAGFLVGEVNGEAIACISAVCYDRTFAFIGLYIVKPEWRGRGYGKQIWQAAWQQLAQRLDVGQRSIGLDSVVERESTYAKSGFNSAYRHIRFMGETANYRTIPTEVIPLADVPFEEVLRYDSELFPASRPQFLQPWIAIEGGAAYGVLENGILKGYGVLRPCTRGYKIGPLFADNREIAECIFRALNACASPQPIFLDIPDINPAMTFLTRKYELQPVFTCIRMYCGRTPTVDVDRIFGVTTLELG